MEEYIQGYIDEYKRIIGTERITRADKEKYSYLITFLENMKKEIKELDCFNSL